MNKWISLSEYNPVELKTVLFLYRGKVVIGQFQNNKIVLGMMGWYKFTDVNDKEISSYQVIDKESKICVIEKAWF